MSAFIVNQKHINALVKFFAGTGEDVHIYMNGRKEPVKFNAHGTASLRLMGQILIDENYRSVNNRYNDGDEPEEFKYNLGSKYYEPVQILKAIQCLVYQSCETEDYNDSLAYKICQTLKTRAIQKLVGYDEAEWEIS